MKKIALFMIIAALLLISAPVAAGDKEPVGDRLGWDVTQYYADTPFHFMHGWFLGPTPLTVNPGGYYYELELNGEIIKPSYKIIGYNTETGVYDKLYVHNFPEGMTGTHNFIHHYYGTCSDYYDDCKNPGASIEVHTIFQTIVFTDPYP